VAANTAPQRCRPCVHRRWIASPEDTIIAKLEWAVASGADRQLNDVTAMLDIGGHSLDLAYIDRWVAGLGLQAAWSRSQALRSAD